MSDTVAQLLSNYTETVTVPEYLPLTCLVWYLFLEFDDQKDRAEQLKSIFYGFNNPDNFKMLEDMAHQEKPMRDCLEAAKQAATQGKIEQYDQDHDFERFERDKLKISKFYTVSFLIWAEEAGYSIPEYIAKEIRQRLEYYCHGQYSRNEERHKFPEIDQQEFDRRTNEPLWRMTDAILYALGYQSRANEEAKISFLRYKDRAKRLMNYIFDAHKTKDLTLYDFDDHLFDVDQKDIEEKRMKSLYAGRVKPKEFVTWLEGLALDIPILEGKIEKLVKSHVQAGGYSTPYIDLIIKAIKELNISDNDQPPKKNIVEWLGEQNPDLSEREKESMATFVRLPRMKKGGYHASGKKKGDTQ